MKKLVLVLVAMFGLYLGANAQVLSCEIYNSDGLIVKLGSKGEQSDSNGQFSIPISVSAPSNSKWVVNKISKDITVYVEIIDQNSGRVVKREPVTIPLYNGSGSKTHWTRDYKPNYDYLFSIDKNKTCI